MITWSRASSRCSTAELREQGNSYDRKYDSKWNMSCDQPGKFLLVLITNAEPAGIFIVLLAINLKENSRKVYISRERAS